MKLKFMISGGKVVKNENEIPFLIYSDDKRYWNVFKPICREFHKRRIEVVYMTSSKDDPVFNCEYDNVKAEYIGETNKAFAKLNYVNASIFLSTTPGLEVYQWKRSKNVKYYVHIPHMAHDITTYRMFGLDYYDAILLSADYQENDIRALEKMRNLPTKELYKVGIPYMDEMVERFAQAKDIERVGKTVLLAPTWGPSGIFARYEGKIIDALLKTDYHIIIRPHPQSFISEKEMMNRLMKKYPGSAQLEWNQDNDNFGVLQRSDVLITDFSGVIFDFSLIFDKPIIYTNPQFDMDVYDAWWLKKPLWTLSALPRLGLELRDDNIDNIKELIDVCLTDDSYVQGRREVKAETWKHIGCGAVRTVDYLTKKYGEIEK